MSNEELVAGIQAGDHSLITALWEQCEQWIRAYAIKWEQAFHNKQRCNAEDLCQSGYFALVNAAEKYHPDRGMSFRNYLTFYLKTEFSKTVGNQKLHTVSLDAPLADAGEGGCLIDIIADPAGEQGQEALEDSIYLEQLRAAMDHALQTLKSERHKEVLRLRFWENLSLQAVGDRLGIGKEAVRQIESKALRRLRKPETACKLIPFWDFNYYAGTSLASFKSNWRTVQEQYLIRQEERQERERLRQARRKAEKYLKEAAAQLDEAIAAMTPEEKERLWQAYICKLEE